MRRLSRRSFLAATAATVASPAVAQTIAPLQVDVAIVGAGAAGIAAARRLASAGRRFVLLEATDHTGGRCVTETRTFGVPFDRGAHWIHMPDINPVATLAQRSGVDIYPAPAGQKVRVGRRNAREGEMEEYLSALVRANRGMREAARKGEASCAAALPRDLGDWQRTIEFVLGPFGCGKDLHEISVTDFTRSAERDVDAYCRVGFGGLLAKLAEGVPVQLSNAVTRIDWSGKTGVELDTSRGPISARAAIVTASTGVLSAGRIRFVPDLPRRLADSVSRLSLGSYDHIALELPGNPLNLQRDDLVFEKAEAIRTAAILANVSGSSICLVEVGGRFGRELAARGEQGMVTFALDWLGALYSVDLRKVVKRTHATSWNSDPWTLGAFSAAAPNGQPGRKLLMEPLNNRIWFAGEAVHETLWGTVGGAWESGERAANDVLKRLTPPAQDPAQQRRRGRPTPEARDGTPRIIR
jgi:monoamine oxidase